MLTGVLAPTGGSLRVLDLAPDGDVKRRIGVVPDGLLLFDRLTGREHLIFRPAASTASGGPSPRGAPRSSSRPWSCPETPAS